MPDTKLNWSNLKEHLRKRLIAYVVAVALAVALTELMWTMTRPRAPDDRQVLIYLAGPYTYAETLASVAEAALNGARDVHPELEAVMFEDLLFPDPETDYAGIMLLLTRLTTGEADAFFADENAMAALVNAEACLPLDGTPFADSMAALGLEPYYAQKSAEDADESETLLAGFKIDRLTALRTLGAFDNQGSYLTVAANGRNVESTLTALRAAVEALLKEGER